jgi:hypothetical protein
MHGIDEGNRILNRRLLHDAVAKVEDMTGMASGLIENLFGPATDFGLVS